MKKAMIFAAGLGTRLAPLTNDRPKALVELNGRSLLWHVAERLAEEGFHSLTINVHHFAKQIKDYVVSPPFAEYAVQKGLHIAISDESDRLLDTGGGLRKAMPLLFADGDDCPVLIHNVDIMSNANLAELYENAEGVDALLLVSERKTSRYFLFNDEMRLVGWQNIETGEVRSPYPELDTDKCRRLAFSGIHVVSKGLVEAMQDWPDKFGITDFYIKSCRDLNIRGYVQQESLELVDIGKIEVLKTLENASQNGCDTKH